MSARSCTVFNRRIEVYFGAAHPNGRFLPQPP